VLTPRRSPDLASEYRYREGPVDRSGLTILISQSGETADTLASLRNVQEVVTRGGRLILMGQKRAAEEASLRPSTSLQCRTRTPISRRSSMPIMGTDADQPRNLAK
jgi:glucosamine 6-phosphate synthetase-like amidotransferase/phosphosugar isomerase protein